MDAHYLVPALAAARALALVQYSAHHQTIWRIFHKRKGVFVWRSIYRFWIQSAPPKKKCFKNAGALE